MLDPGEVRIRTALQADLSDFARVLDSLEFCDFIVNPLIPTDIPEEEVPIERFFASLSDTTKHCDGGLGTVEGARQVIELGSMLTGGFEKLRAPSLISMMVAWHPWF